jgi:hypothetical protein
LKAGERDSLPSPLKLKDCREIITMNKEQVLGLLDKWMERAKHEAISQTGWMKGFNNGMECAFGECRLLIEEYLQSKGE